MFELKGMLSLQAGDRTLGGFNRIELLEQIGRTGSITSAVTRPSTGHGRGST